MLSVNRRAATDLDAFWGPIPAARTALVAGLIALIVYVGGLSPYVHTFDPAQFQSLARSGGIAHSGYPTLVLLLRGVGALPFGTLAWRANLLSALSGTIVVALLAYTATRWTRRPLASVVGALAFMLSLSAWKESSLAGVHIWTLALGATLFLLALRYAWWPSLRVAAAAGLLFGLGLTSHLTVLGLAPVLLVAFATGLVRSAYRTRHVIAVVIALACGLSPFAMLVLNDRSTQPMNYLVDTLEPGPLVPASGEPSLGLRIARVRWLVSGAQYLGGLRRDAGTLARLGTFLVLDEGVNEFPFVTFPLALLGLIVLWSRSRRLGLWLALWFGMACVFTLIGSSAYTSRFFFLPGAYGLALGLAFLLGEAERGRGWVARLAMLVVLAMPFVRLTLAEPPVVLQHAPMLPTIWRLWPDEWQPWHHERRYDDYGRGVMARLPQHAVVLGMGWDESTTLRYFVYGERLRPDVDVRYTGPRDPRLSRHFHEAIAAGRPVYATGVPLDDALPDARVVGVWDSGWHGLWRLDPVAPAPDSVSPAAPTAVKAH